MTPTTLRLQPLLAACAAAATTLCALPAHAADAPAYAIFGDGTYIGDRPNTSGFIFTALQDVALTALGFHDHLLDGLNLAHEVALYSTTGTVLAQATVAAGTAAPLIGEHRYTMLAAPLQLQAGTSYVLAAHTDASDGYRYAIVPPSTLTVNPQISIGNDAAFYNYGPSLTFPQSVFIYDIYATPNMLLAGPVPEPGTWALFGLGLAALLAGRGRRVRDWNVQASSGTLS